MNRTDVLILGSGIAGLSTAIKIAEIRPDIKVTVITKTVERESNTKYAQGGVAAVWDHAVDAPEKHFEDTIIAGDQINDRDVVRFVVEEGPDRVREIIDWGARFDKEKSGQYSLGREGGHSENRILHYKDLTGAEIQRTLINRAAELANIEILEHYFALDLVTQHHLGFNVTRVTPGITCYGAYVLNKSSGDIELYLSKITLLATGGSGQVYRSTTNPVIATGDGIAMTYRAKGRVGNMEFVQFHPTALYTPEMENPAFLISEAVRGAGGILKNRSGEAFMDKYDARGSLAPRDIVARAIDNEMKIRGDDYVLLDCTHLDAHAFDAQFPTIKQKCRSLGINPSISGIPVVPACHYMCGGIIIDHHGRTSIDRLYACGECTNSGLHGANRLASNSLLEGLVFAHRIAGDVAAEIDACEVQKEVPEWNAEGTTHPGEMVLITQSIKEVKDIMSAYVGIVRSNERLKRASNRLYLLYRETEYLYQTTTLSPQLCELRNLITIGYLIIRMASMRKESRGLHFNTDYPGKNAFLENTLL